MIVAIHQPSYWPWLGLLDKIAKSDVFVVLDTVQLNKDSYQRRNVFSAAGKKKYLTVPIDYHLGVKINEVHIKDPDFPAKHIETIRNWYLKSDFFEETMDLIRPLYQQRYEKLIDIVTASLFVSLEVFGITCRVMYASKLAAPGSKGSLVLNICKMLGADVYLSGRGALEYFQEDDYEAFRMAGIDLAFQEFQHPVYPQFNTAEFLPGLGCLDMLFNCGVAKSRHIFQKNLKG